MPKIKKDFLGLYVTAGGYVARPVNGTVFKEGDVVKTYHFGGSTNAGVTTMNQNFSKKVGKFEIWTTTGVMYHEYDTMSQNDIKTKTDWYINMHTSNQLKMYNHNFKLYIRKIKLNELLNT